MKKSKNIGKKKIKEFFVIDEEQLEISLVCDKYINIDVSKLRTELIDYILNKEDVK